MKRGRAGKYDDILRLLDDDLVYTAADILDFAWEYNLLSKTIYCGNRMRSTLCARARRFKFPRKGDDIITRPGQAPRPAWSGSRWKSTIPLEEEDDSCPS